MLTGCSSRIMKTTKSPESDTTPSKKKLKQARLPFKLISEGSPTPVSPQTRKRKLSASEAESSSKVGKISKENEVIDLVVLSDEDSKDAVTTETLEKPFNPLLKIVDAAWKKKQQKAKVSKKKKNCTKSSKDQNGTVEVSGESATDTGDDRESGDCEMMEVDEPLPSKELDVNSKSTKVSESDKDVTITLKESNISSDTKSAEVNDQLTLSTDSSETEKKSETTEDSSNITTKRTTRSFAKVLEKTTKSLKKNPTENTAAKKDKAETKEVLSDPEDKVKQDKSTEKPDDSGSVELNAEPPPIVVTPKRSSRSKTRVEQAINSPASSKLNESSSSDATNAKQSRSSSVTNSLDETLSDSTKLTPKQLQKKLESAKKKEERDKERVEREKKKNLEKEERAKQKQEKDDQRKREREEKEEAKRKEKEEKDEQKRKEKEEKERQKELEKKLREEKEEQKKKEKEEKEEQRKKEKEAREEEKRKKQEALELEKQEQELKKKKAAEAFANFFVPKQKSENDQAIDGPASKTDMLSSFTIKVDMRLAPTVRTELNEDRRQKLDDLLDKQSATDSNLYLKILKEGTHKPLSNGKTWTLSDKDDDDVLIIEDELPPTDGGEITTCESAPSEKLRPKLLRFIENRRPPYWGTWRKKSSIVKPRRPFGQDKKYLDYEVDSDDDWEEEQEGESIDGSAAGSDDEQDADEYEVDNEVFVPHGYLSDEEATMDEDDVLSLSPEAQKAKLKVLEDEFESEMKKPTEKLKPRLYGLLWENNDGGKPEKCVDAIWNYFGKLSMIMNDPTPFLQPTNEVDDTEKKKVKKKKSISNEGEQTSPKNTKKKKQTKSNCDEKESKKPKPDTKKNTPEVKKNQPGINMFLTKFKST